MRRPCKESDILLFLTPQTDVSDLCNVTLSSHPHVTLYVELGALGCEYGLGVTYANWPCSYRINQLITRERSGRDHVSAELGRDI